MILNDNFKSIGDYFNHEEEYLGEFFHEADKTEYEKWFGVSVNEILFTTSDDDYDFITKVIDYITQPNKIVKPIKTIRSERFYNVDGCFNFTYTYHEGGLSEVKFRKVDKESLDKFFK